MRKFSSCRSIGITLCVIALSACTDSVRDRTNKPGHDVPDCLSSSNVVRIRPGQIGELSLDLPLSDVLQRCPNLRWSTINGDETLDTAIVLDHGRLRVIGAVATLLDDDGDHRPVHLDARQPVKWWEVSGEPGLLPLDVPLNATWSDVAGAYGPLRASALNGTVYVEICRQLGLTLLINIPTPDAPINGASARVIDSVMATTRIRAVRLRAAGGDRSGGC
ncbi:MAG: hypothetical protein ACJ796_10095 [Gemmatimonadaceae bacterium]